MVTILVLQYNIYFIVKETNRLSICFLLCYNYSMIKKIVKENYLIIMLIVITIIIFYVLKNSNSVYKIIDFDNKVIEFFKYLHVNKFTNIMKTITFFGDWYIPVLIIVCIFLAFKNKWYSYIMTTSYAFAGVLAFITKFLIARPRPLVALTKIPSSYSFPSGHTLTSIVFYLTLCYLITINLKDYKRKILLFLITTLIFFVALSRVYLGVHFFSDVIGGFILGILCEIFIIRVINKNFIDKIIKKQ